QWLAEQSIGGADELIVRRVVGADGRSRAYLNGQAVPLQALREAGELLIDIHGQHEFQSLTRSAAQRVLLDEYGSLSELTSQVGIAHPAWLGLRNRTLELDSKARDRDTRLGPMLEEASMQAHEAARELERYRETLDVDAARQEEVERRLAAVEELSRKHRVPAPELTERARQLALELATLERAEVDLAALRKQLAEALESYRTQAQELSARRVRTSRELSRDISARMQTLGMSGGRFEADVTQNGNADPTEHGIDSIEFRVTANPGQPPRALAKVASGGELARLSLAVQVSGAAQ